MKSFLQICLTVALLTGGTAFGQPFENSSVVGQVPDRIVITLRPGVALNLEKSADMVRADVPALQALARQFSVRSMEQLYAGLTGNLADKAMKDQLDRVVAVDFPAEMGLQRVRAAFAARPEVEQVQLVDICRNYAYLPDDPGVAGLQWYVRNMNLGGGDVRAVGAWNQALGDSNVVVAIVDSGVDWQHPDLGGPHPDKVNGAIWTNWEEYTGTGGVDDDGNGKVDDVRGWDFVNVPGQGYPDEDDDTPDNDPMDYESHGTACAGTVAGIGDNGVGVAGVAHGCKVMAVRVGWLPDGDDIGVVRMDFAAAGILYAANSGADVINCSWGSTSYLSAAVSAAVSAGVVIVTAAGNDNTDNDPGLGVPSYLSTHPDVLSVAATEPSDGKASFSNYGTWVELSAPGTGIYTTWYDRSTLAHTYSTTQGTSFSSPIACAAVALIWSAQPGLSRSGVISALLASCDDIDAVNPVYAGLLGAGRINLLKALGDGIHRFPDEFPTVFDAVNEAADGDTVAVTTGAVIPAPLTVLGRNLKVLGGYSANFATRDPLGAPTVVTGNLSSTVLRFQGTVTTGTVIDGFSFRGGGGQNYSGIPYTAKYGGGAIVKDASPTLRNLEFTGNSVGSASQLGCGGGLMLVNSQAVLDNVSIHHNTGLYGAGLFAYNSALTMVACSIHDNTAITSNLTYVPKGGGLHALDTDLTMSDCTVSGHLNLENGGGMYVAGFGASSTLDMTGGGVSGNSAKANGGGLYHSGGTATLHAVSFTGNSRLGTSTFMNGGGFYIVGAGVAADSLVCTGNVADIGGGGILINCPSATLDNSVLAGNTANYFGGGLTYQNNPLGSLAGNTIAGNAGTALGGGGIYLADCSPSLVNTISAFNTGAASFGNGIACNVAPSLLSCNDVFGNSGSNYSGVADPTGTNGNVSVDPAFCDAGAGDYRVAAASPCAPANSGGCGLIGALAVCGLSPVPGTDGQVPAVFRVDQNFPNPFNPLTTIRFDLAAPGRTKVAIFDLVGRHVRTLLDEPLPAATHEVTWNGQDAKGRQVAAGIYFYMVTSGAESSVGRMALVK